MVETAKSVVLCIDDDEHLLMICKLIFGQEGYQVFAAPNGWGGIEIFRRDRIDGVILDYVMPGMGETNPQKPLEQRLLIGPARNVRSGPSAQKG